MTQATQHAPVRFDHYRPAIEHLTSAAAARLLNMLDATNVQASILEELLQAVAGPEEEADETLRERLRAARALLQSLLRARAATLRTCGDP